MSGDVQPRKRKGQRRKKDEGLSDISRKLSTDDVDDLPSPPVSHKSGGHGAHGGHGGGGDRSWESIHEHHDHGIGGGIFVKIIFFAMLAALLGVTGVIFIELRGSTDVDAPSVEDSKFAEYFSGWLDESPDEHGHDDHAVAGSEEEHGDHDEDAHDDDEPAHSDENETDEDDGGHSEAEEFDAAATEEDETADDARDDVDENLSAPADIQPDEDDDDSAERQRHHSRMKSRLDSLRSKQTSSKPATKATQSKTPSVKMPPTSAKTTLKSKKLISTDENNSAETDRKVIEVTPAFKTNLFKFSPLKKLVPDVPKIEKIKYNDDSNERIPIKPLSSMRNVLNKSPLKSKKIIKEMNISEEKETEEEDESEKMKSKENSDEEDDNSKDVFKETKTKPAAVRPNLDSLRQGLASLRARLAAKSKKDLAEELSASEDDENNTAEEVVSEEEDDSQDNEDESGKEADDEEDDVEDDSGNESVENDVDEIDDVVSNGDDDQDDVDSSEKIDNDQDDAVNESLEDEDYDLTQEDDSDDESEPDKKDLSKELAEDSIESADITEAENESSIENDAENDDLSEDVQSKEIRGSGKKRDDKSKPSISTPSEEQVEIIEESEEALQEEEEAIQKEEVSVLDDDEDVEDFVSIKQQKMKERDLMRKLKKLLKEKEASKVDGESNSDEELVDESEQTGGVALKLGVGVALIVVAHMVIVRRWRSLTYHADNELIDESEVETKNEEPTEAESKPKIEEIVLSRRQTLVSETTVLPKDSDEPEELDDISEPPILKRRTSMDVKLERQDSSKYYTPEELEELADSEELEEEYLEEEEFLEEELGEEEENEFEVEGSRTPSDLGEPEELMEEEEEEELLEEEEYEEDVEQEEEISERPPVPPPRRGPQGLDVDDDRFNDLSADEEVLAKEDQSSDVTGAIRGKEFDEPDSLEAEPKLREDDDDWLFRQELDFADEQFNNNHQLALDAYSRVLQRAPASLRAAIGRARSLDKLAELKRSNSVLLEATAAYQTLLTANQSRLDNGTFRSLLARAVDRMRFSGRNAQAAQLLQVAASRFPEEVEHPNAMAVCYLIAGSNAQAQKVLEATLKKWPQDGFALVHLGFIHKTAHQNLELGAKLLEKGLVTQQNGTLDGRFVFHLGDALHRLGRFEEAMRWYEFGAEKGLFKSKYQRSLYNVDRLKALPWWSIEETTYTQFFRSLERNWKKIREEGMALLRARDAALFQDEAESLKDTGDWKQLDLYARGRKQPGCLRAPYTCQMIANFPAASSCTRGQAKFSVMEPATHVWPHCGPTNCRLRAHLGLVVPAGVYLRVAQTTKSWEEGKVLVFDDSFEHEVWHNGSSVRLVLIVDVWHPELTPSEKQTLSPI